MGDLGVQKKRGRIGISGAERITGVKNSQAEVLLTRKVHQLHTLYKKREQDIQLEELRLENEAKLLDLESKKSALEYKRRLNPDSDLSHEEMIVRNLEKYLVRNSTNVCYTDKSLNTKIRGTSAANVIPPVVAEARGVVARKELLQAVENNRKRMYSFLVKDKRDARSSTMKKASHVDLPNSVGNHQTTFELPTVSTKYGEPDSEKKLLLEKLAIREKLEANPLVRAAFESHRQLRAQDDSNRPVHTARSIISRMMRKKPLTKSQLKEEMEKVNFQVDTFCQKIENILWSYKEEEFQQKLKFVKDKDNEWNRFMETMQARNRSSAHDGHSEDSSAAPVAAAASMKRSVKTAHAPSLVVLSERQKEELLQKNLLLGRARTVDSAPAAVRGIPHHTAKRSLNHSPTNKLRRMLESSRTTDQTLGKPGEKEQPSAGLVIAIKQSEVAAK